MEKYERPLMDVELIEDDVVTTSCTADERVPPCDTETPTIPIG